MKKNISINISGIIFHIEEDGYDKLKEYLETIHRYFSSYDDSSEIIADIENRIAEIFLSKLKDGVQVITIEDVEALMATMGGIKDFKEIEVEEEEKEFEAEETFESESGASYKTESKTLFRDEKRKILGGVLSGIAHYFSIDPLWTRLLFIVLFFGVWFFPSTPVLLGVAYIIMWIIVPGTYNLEDQKKVKKMFRNPDGKVLGGVASGVGAYFGIDIVIVRLIFVVLALFGGSGLILYVILWIILPEARTITDKMEMQGEPVTLRNIETNIKKSLKVETNGEESLLMKILLFPFRIIAAAIKFLSQVLGPVAVFFIEAIRVIFGLILVLIAVVDTLGLLIAGGAILGLFTGSYFMDHVDFPIDLIRDEFTIIPLIAGFFAWLIPQVFLVILGISVITKKLMLNAKIGWSLFALWIISIIILAFSVPSIIGRYSRDGVYSEVDHYTIEAEKTVVLKLKQVGLEDYEVANLKLRGHEDSIFRLEKKFEARGKTRMEAIENAKMVTYNVDVKDSVLVFDSNIIFNEGAKFRGQELNMILYIPYNRPFLMNEDLRYIIRNTIYYYGYQVSDMERNTWMFTDDGLECITCKGENSSKRESNARSSNGDMLEFDLSDFTSVDIGSIFSAEIIQDDDWEVSVSGREDDLDDVVVKVLNSELEINFTRDISKWDKDREEVKVYIRMPDLESIDFSGAAKCRVQGFDQRRMEISLSGATVIDMEVELTEAKIRMGGVSKLKMFGRGEELEADISGAASLDAGDYIVDYAIIDVTGASRARVNVEKELEIDVSGGSVVRYLGNPMVKSDRASGSSIIKE